MSLTCETCDALLIDLVERELDETRAAEVRAHASGCEACGRALVRLEGGRRAAQELVRAEPPRLDAVMAAARARAAEVRAAASAQQERTEAVSAPSVRNDAEPAEGWLDAAIRWLGAMATRPQVAMAALLVLMVGIGIFNLPQFRAREGADSDGALVEPDVRAELGPSALAPAQPLPLEVDPRTQRVALGTGVAPADGEGERDERPTTTIAQADEPSAERHASPRAVPDTTEAQAETPGGDIERTSPDVIAMAEIGPSDSLGRVEDGPLPDVAAAPDQTAMVVAPMPAPAAVAPRPTTPSARSSSRPPSVDEVAPPTTSVAAAMPAAIHRQARSLASAGRCDEAVPRYRALLADHPDYADAPRAMIELADCDRHLGRFDDAERWLTRAEAFPSVSADARRVRTLVATGRRAAEPPVDRAGAAASSPDVRASTPPDTASSAY